MKYLVGQLSLRYFVVVGVKARDGGPFDARDGGALNERGHSVVRNIEKLADAVMRHSPKIIINGTSERDVENIPVERPINMFERVIFEELVDARY